MVVTAVAPFVRRVDGTVLSGYTIVFGGLIQMSGSVDWATWLLPCVAILRSSF